MNNKKSINKGIILNIIISLILISGFLICYFNMIKLEVIGSIGISLILPYGLISIIVQIIILFLNYISKSGKKFLIIITLILEILNIIFANITFIPFLFLKLLSNIKRLAYLIIIIYEVLNVYTITLTIKLVKESDRCE